MRRIVTNMRAALFTLAAMVLAVAVASAQQASPPAPTSAVLGQTRADFCSEVQRSLTGTALPMSTRLHTDYDAFVQSKPQIQPLQAQQYVQYEDSAGAQPMRISCKTKTADHINVVYGAGSAPGGDVSCRDVNRSIINAAWSAMSAPEREHAAFAPWRIMLDGDDVGFMGNRFIAPYEFAYLGTDGLPHVLAKALRVDWENWLWKIAPDRVRGTHYCHLIAPEFARRVMRGEVRLRPNAGS
jgi:hypothetical protein